MSTFLGFDQSTSATKAVLFDTSGTILDKVALDHQQIYPQPGWVEHDAEKIWQNLLRCATELRIHQPDLMDQVRGVSIANQRETFVVFDRETGTPLHNAVVWLCRRGDPECERLAAEGLDALIQEATGLKLNSYFPAPKITALMKADSDVAERVRSGEACVSTIDAYLIHRMTGGRQYATDHTNASRTLLYDVRKLGWHPGLCEVFSVPVGALPEVRDSGAVFGETDLGGALKTPTPISGVMGDSQASLFAQRCYTPGTGKATFGTGTSVMVNVGGEPITTDGGAVLALAWTIEGKPTYALEGLINYSSATVAWLQNQLNLLDDPADSERMARAVEGNGGVYLVPAFAGLSAPYWNADARAAILGMSGHTTKEHVVRAALESIAYQIRDVLAMIADSAGVKPGTMCADGGPTRNGFLMQFTADLTSVKWNVSQVAESSALGAAFAGMLGLEMHKSLEDLAALPRETVDYLPQMPEQEANRLHDGWVAAVKRVL